MKVEITKNGHELMVTAQGFLDTTAASDFESRILKEIDDVKRVVIDCSGIEYISSKGLRALVYIQKTLGPGGNVIITNPNKVVRESMSSIGFDKVVTVE